MEPYGQKNRYELSPEHQEQLAPWAEQWIANAMSTKEMDAHDRQATTDAVNGLYDAAGLSRPKHIVFVPSPLVLAFAGCFAAGIWHVARHGLPRAATRDATWAATRDATKAATWAATRDATEDGAYARFLLSCLSGWWRMWNGGNQWSGYVAYLSFFDRVASLDLPIYEKWRHYEAVAIHAGPRVMHPDFCMVSDRPAILLVDDDNRPHCADGPSHRWRDGWSLYYWHGIRVPSWAIEYPDRITSKVILGEKNIETRRAMIEIAGVGRLLDAAEEINQDDTGRLYRIATPDDEAIQLVEVADPSTDRVYHLRVPPGVRTARGAVAWTFDMAEHDYLLTAEA